MRGSLTKVRSGVVEATVGKTSEVVVVTVSANKVAVTVLVGIFKGSKAVVSEAAKPLDGAIKNPSTDKTNKVFFPIGQKILTGANYTKI